MTTRRKSPPAVLLLFAFFLLSGCATKNAVAAYPVDIVNQSSHAICRVKFYPAGPYHIHAPNLLKVSLFKKESIPPGQTGAVTVEEGLYDIRIETCDGLVTGTDYFSVPQDASWAVSDEKLFTPVR